jgi:hypothetical protein
VDLLALRIFFSVVGESFREEDGRGFGDDFFRYERVVPAGFYEEELAGEGSHTFSVVLSHLG